MINFIYSNLPTIIGSAAVLGAISLILVRMIKNRKKPCSGCSHCPNAGVCHHRQ